MLVRVYYNEVYDKCLNVDLVHTRAAAALISLPAAVLPRPPGVTLTAEVMQ